MELNRRRSRPRMLRTAPHKGGKTPLRRAFIFTDVDPRQNHLPKALLYQDLHRGHGLFWGKTARRPPGLGDNAKTAVVVAPILNLEEGPRPPVSPPPSWPFQRAVSVFLGNPPTPDQPQAFRRGDGRSPGHNTRPPQPCPEGEARLAFLMAAREEAEAPSVTVQVFDKGNVGRFTKGNDAVALFSKGRPHGPSLRKV